jgi:hypothetical protein
VNRVSRTPLGGATSSRRWSRSSGPILLAIRQVAASLVQQLADLMAYFIVVQGWVEAYETLNATSRTQEAMCALDKDGKIIGATQMLGNDLGNPARANLAWPSIIGALPPLLPS